MFTRAVVFLRSLECVSLHTKVASRAMKRKDPIAKARAAMQRALKRLKAAKRAMKATQKAVKDAMGHLAEVTEVADGTHHEVTEGYCTLCGRFHAIDKDCMCLGCFVAFEHDSSEYEI